MITEYPPLTSGTLVVLSLGLLPRLPPSRLPSVPSRTRQDLRGMMTCDGMCGHRSKWDRATIASRSSLSFILVCHLLLLLFLQLYSRHVLEPCSSSLLYPPLPFHIVFLFLRSSSSRSRFTSSPSLPFLSFSPPSLFASCFVSFYLFYLLPRRFPWSILFPILSLSHLLPLFELPHALPVFFPPSHSPLRSFRLAH